MDQHEKFVEAARKLGTDDDEAAFEGRLRRVASAFSKEENVTIHASDCAINNAPAYDPGHCDCGASKAGQ
jgi:hypothetical protein